MTDEELQEAFAEWVRLEGTPVGLAQRTVWEEVFKLWRSRERAIALLRAVMDPPDQEGYVDAELEHEIRAFLKLPARPEGDPD